MTEQEKQEQARLRVDTLIKEIEEIFTKSGMKVKRVNQTGSFVYFPKRKSPLKDTKGEEEK